MERWLRYTVLPVGQGTGTLVQVWEGQTRFTEDASAKPIESALIDVGSSSWGQEAGRPSGEFVVGQLKLMAKPTLSAVFLSHPDKDHVNLIQPILKQFAKPSEHKPDHETLRVGKFWFGGADGSYVKGGVDVLELLTEYGGAEQWLSIPDSSWDDGRPSPLFSSDLDVQYWLLIANADTTEPIEGQIAPRKALGGYFRNVASLILIVKYGSAQPRRIVATGDATGFTLAASLGRISQMGQIEPVISMDLPHHGSKSTTYNLLGLTGPQGQDSDTLASVVVAAFVGALRPRAITASAGEYGGYFHPAGRVIRDFGTHIEEGAYVDPALRPYGNQHFFTAYYEAQDLTYRMGAAAKWPPTNNWYTGRTAKNVFTIDYFKGDSAHLAVPEAFPPTASAGGPGPPYLSPAPKVEPPPRVAGWAFYVSADGSKYELKRGIDLRFVGQQARSALESVHGPLPPRRFVFLPSAPLPAPDERTESTAPPAPVTEAPPPSRRQPRPGTPHPRQIP